MSGFSNVLKNGWHPDKDTDLKKQVTGIFKKSDDKYSNANHTSRPLSSLRDPASFGPPPRHVALGGGSPVGGAAAAAPTSAAPSRPSVPPRAANSPSTSSYRPAAAAAEEDDEPPAPRPYRVDTSGLSTAHLPPPPLRRDGADGRSPPPPYRQTQQPRPTPPGLPPRLPPRNSPAPAAANTHSPPPPAAPSLANRLGSAASVSPSHTGADGYVNQAAVNRLGRAGVSVPGLGIGAGGDTTTPGNARQQATALSSIASVAAAHAAPSPRPSAAEPSAQPSANNSSQLGELQARFAKMGTGGGGGSAPSRSAVPSSALSPSTLSAASSAAGFVAGKKKPPPPPVKKKPEFGQPNTATPADDGDGEPPPPVPMATRPQRW